MTFKEKLAQEHPDCVREDCLGGCMACPWVYDYEEEFFCLGRGDIVTTCDECWGREMR